MCKLLLLFMVTTIAQRPLLVGGFFHRIFHFLKLASSSGVKVKSLSHVRLFATPRNVAYQAPPSMEFFRQEYWSGLPFPSPPDHPDPGIEPRSPALRADAVPFEPLGKLQESSQLSQINNPNSCCVFSWVAHLKFNWY